MIVVAKQGWPIFIDRDNWHYILVYLLNCDYRFCDSRKSDKCFLVFAKFAKVINVLLVLRTLQKWHAETREGPIL